MAQDKPLTEDAAAAPVTTTDNAGAGLVLPEKPISNNILSRFRELKKSRKKENNK
jgi:hypothetical protein